MDYKHNILKVLTFHDNPHFKKILLCVLTVVVVGLLLTFSSLASTPFVSIEAEQGSLAAGAVTGDDSTASGGQYVQFGNSAVSSELPTPQTTGWQHTGVTLNTCSQTTINGTPGGTVVDGCDFPAGSSVTINGGGPVTLKRSRIRAMGEESTAVYIAAGAGPVTIEDVEITSLDRNSQNRIDRTIVIQKNNTQPVTVTRLYAHDARRGMFITSQNNITIQDSYHAFNYNPPTNGDCAQERAHSSAISAAGGVYNLNILNTVLGGSECAIFSGLIATYPEQGANHDILIDGGMWICPGTGSSYGIAAGYSISGGEQQNYGFTVKNLKISTQANSIGCPAGNGQRWNSSSSSTGSLGNPKAWENNTKYNPGQPDHSQPIGPEGL